MKNKDVVRAFRDGIECHTLNLYSVQGRLMSYNTCIAQKYNGRIYYNPTKYSATTSKHQSLVRGICDIIELNCHNIPINTVILNRYIHEYERQC